MEKIGIKRPYGKIGTKGPYVRVKAVTDAPRQENWKPFAIKLPFLIFIALLCLLYIALLEVLMHKSTPLPDEVWIMPLKPNVTTFSANKMARAPLRTAPVLLLRDTSMMMTTSACATTSTVIATVTVVVSGSVTGVMPIPVSSSRPCVATRTVTITSVRSAYLTPVSSSNRPFTTTTAKSAYLTPVSSSNRPLNPTTANSAYLTPVSSNHLTPTSSSIRPSTTTASKDGYLTPISPSIRPFTTTASKDGYLTPISTLSPSSATISPKPSACTTISTEYVTITVVVSGTNISVMPLPASPSRSCVATRTFTITTTRSGYLNTASTISPSPAASSSKSATCTTTSTVYATAEITVSGTARYTSIHVGPSQSCAVTSTVTEIVTKSAFLNTASTISTNSGGTNARGFTVTPTGYSQTPSSVSIFSTGRQTHSDSTSSLTTPSFMVSTMTTTPMVIPYVTTQESTTTMMSTSAVLPTDISAYLTPVSPTPTAQTTHTATPGTSSLYLTPSNAHLTPLSPSSSPTLQTTQTAAPASTNAYLTPLSPSSSPTLLTTQTSALTSTNAYTSPASEVTSSSEQTTTPRFVVSGFWMTTTTTTTTTTSSLVNVESSSMTTSTTSDTQEASSTTSTTTSTSQLPPQITSNSVFQQIQDLRKPDMLLTGDNTTRARRWAALYLPGLLAIIIRQVWAITAVNLKMMEPFYQLNRPDGASARKSLMDDHLGGINSLNSFANALRGGILSITVIVVSLIVDLLAPLSTESMTTMALSYRYLDDGTLQPLNPGWVLNRFFVRLLEAMLVFFLFVVVLIAILDRRRRSGLSANPSKIATMTSLLKDRNVVNDLHQISSNASNDEIEASIVHNRYGIANHQVSESSSVLGLVKVSEATPQRMHRVPLNMSINPEERRRTKLQIWGRFVDGLLVFLLVGILATVIGYWLDGSDSGFNRFFNSRQFGPKFILSFGASITTTTFQSLEREVRLTTPYRRLAERNAAPHSTILQSVNGTEVSGFVRGLRYGAIFPTFVALVTLLGNVLVIVIAGVPYDYGITWNDFTFNASYSVAVSAIMFGTAIAIFFWRRKNKRLKIPYEPNGSLIAMWMSVSNSENQLRAMLNTLDDLSERSLKDRVERHGDLYWAGWDTDDHGRRMWCVDREFPVIQTDLNDSRTGLNRGAELEENPYARTTYRDNQASQRQDLSRTLPIIQTEYREAPIRRGQQVEHQDISVRQRSHAEQEHPLVQNEYRDHPAVQPARRERRQLHSSSHYDESDITDRSNVEQRVPHMQTDYRRESGGHRGVTEGTRLLQR